MNIMSILKKKTNAKEVTTFEAEKTVVQGCTFEGEVLERLKDWARTSNSSVAGDRLSESLQQLNITGIHLSGNKILTGEGKSVILVPARNVLTGPHYPLIVVKDSVCEYIYAIVSKEQFYLKDFQKTSNDGTVTFFFKKNNNISSNPAIVVKKGNWEMIASIDGELDSRIPLLEDQLLELNLTKELTPKTVYEVLSKYFNVPMTITFEWIEFPYVYKIWEMRVVDGICKMYCKYSINDDNMSEYKTSWKIDKDEKSFCYRTDTVEYALRNGEFVFKSNSKSYDEMFRVCKNEIEKFRSEMEHLLD